MILVLSAIVFILTIAVAAYALYFSRAILKYSKLRRLATAIDVLLLAIVVDNVINLLSLLSSVEYPTVINNFMWCWFMIALTLIVWELYNYFREA